MDRSPFITFVKSESFPKIVLGIGIAVSVIIIFEAGVLVGRHEAAFSSRWGENYERNFGGPGNSMMGVDSKQPNANGTFGKIIQIASSTIVIAGQNAPEERVVLTNDTVIRNREANVSASTLTVGDNVVVLGEPDQHGEITARLIRIVPAPTNDASAQAAPSTP